MILALWNSGGVDGMRHKRSSGAVRGLRLATRGLAKGPPDGIPASTETSPTSHEHRDEPEPPRAIGHRLRAMPTGQQG